MVMMNCQAARIGTMCSCLIFGVFMMGWMFYGLWVFVDMLHNTID